MKLTLPQQDVYFEQLMFPDDPIYNIGAKISIEGNIVYEILNQAYIKLIDQHDSYRSILNESEEEVTIQIAENHDSVLEYLDFSFSQNADEQANEFMQKKFETAIKLDGKELLHKFILIKVNESHHYLFSVYHHIITDGWGTSLMFQRLVKNYNEIVLFGSVTSEYPFTYQDFVHDDQAYFLSEEYEKDKNYWKEKFEHLPEQLLEKKGNSDKPNESRRKEIIVKRAVYNELDQLGKSFGCTTFHVILGVLYLYFGRKHQNADFTIGLPVLNRGKSSFKKTVGLFMGVSPLRIQFQQDHNFEELIKNIKQQLRQDYRHQRFPLGKLIKELGLFQENDRLFNITLSYEKQNYADHFINTETKVIPLSHHSERVALAIYIREFDLSEDVKIDFDYNVNYFSSEDISMTAVHFETLLLDVINNPVQSLFEYHYITENEKAQLLESFNQTQFAYREETTLIDAFKERLNNTPDKIVLKDKEKEFTYRELDLYSDKIARYLQKNTNEISPLPVAVLMDRSVYLVAVLLGVLKSGSAYIPLDPSFPEDRLQYIIAHSEVQQIITARDLSSNWSFNREMIEVEDMLNNEAPLEEIKLRKVSAANMAYIIYTSGSTGNPKGVAISHKSLLNFLISMQHKPKIEKEDCLFSVTTQSFDISILEFFAPLISGASLYIANQELLSDPLLTVAKLDQLKPSIIQATPSFYQMLYNAGWKGNKSVKVLCGGDLLSETLADKLIETNSELWNMYGPTETTIWSSCKKITKADEASNIGKPIHNTEFYILDNHMQILPVGSVGNIYIGGDGLAQGYFKNQELTDEKFIQSPFNPNKKIYNTGDLGKWNAKGEIEFLGRNDNQVKIRGYRIELGEIETKLNQIENLKGSVVVAQKNSNQESLLIAYVITEIKDFDPRHIIHSLREELPEYMIPHTILRVDEFPLTPNKKIDRKALSLREIVVANSTASHVEPSTEIQIRLHEYYKEILEIEAELSITDNFFALGGHSLNAVKLINRVHEQLHYKITLKDVFHYPDIESLSEYLEKKETDQGISIMPVQESMYYPITSSQYHIWLASQQEEKSIAYNMSAVFKIIGEIDKTALNMVFVEIQKKHEALRTNFIEVEGIPHQKIFSQKEAAIAVHEFFLEEDQMTEALEEYSNKVFDLEKGPLLGVALFHQKKGDSYLAFVTHHIIMDGWSLENLISEFVNKYKTIGLLKDQQEDSLKFQFKDYAAWHHKQVESTNEKNLKFWNDYLKDYSWKNKMIFDKESFEESHSGAKHSFIYESLNGLELNAFALEHDLSLHTLLVGVFNILIYKMYDNDDFCIGTVNSGRTRSEWHNQLGMFVKTLPLRTTKKSEQTILQVLQATHENLLLIDAHQDIPQSIQNKLRLDALFVLQNPSFDYTSILVNEDLQLQLFPVNESYSRLPLLITFTVHDKAVSGTINYNTANYEKETIELLQLKYEKLLSEILKNSNRTLNDLNIELAIERERTIEIGFNF